MPIGFIKRYQYRKTHLSDGALALCQSKNPLPALLVYAQKNVFYQRTNGKSEIPSGTFDTLFVATRFADVVNVTVSGDKYYFDLRLEGYPSQSEALQRMLAPLVEAGEVPWSRWVVTSANVPELGNLRGGNDADNWAAIVNTLAAPPMQFQNDAFWRIMGPFNRKGKKMVPHVERIKQDGEIREVRTNLLMMENQTWRFELVSHTGTATPSRPQYEVQASISDTDAVKLVGTGRYELRHYTGQQIEYVAQAGTPFHSKAMTLTLSTLPLTTWPSGARLELRHTTRKSHLLSSLGILCGISGVILVSLGASDIFRYDVLNGIVLLVVGLILLPVSKYLLTGSLEFSKP